MRDLEEMERREGKIVIMDYGVKQNPLREEAEGKEEKTIEEM